MIFGSILHGAYGDYYEQAVCLKHFRQAHPNARLKLFAASPYRLSELRTLDFSWAECFDFYTEIPHHGVDQFFQFQAHDRQLRTEVFSTLPDLARKLTSQENRLPWHYLRSILPLRPGQQLGLSDFGRRILPDVMQQNGVRPEIFEKPTIGFLWRYRAAGGAISTVFQQDPKRLVAKYSAIFRRLIDDYGCHILICGMNVQRTPENMYRIDAKYPEYGLDLPAESSTHLKGLNWALELEILSRCTLCVGNPSGFTEALWIKRGTGVVLVDPPAHYVAKAVRHRAPFFNLQRPVSLAAAVASRREQTAFNAIRTELGRAMQHADRRIIPDLQSVAS